jgi:hypothetical protein
MVKSQIVQIRTIRTNPMGLSVTRMVTLLEKTEIVGDRHDHEMVCPEDGTTVVDNGHRQSTTNIMKIYHPCPAARMKTRYISSATQKTKLTKRQLEASAPATGRRVVWTSNERETLVTTPPKIRVDNTLTTVVVTDTHRCLMKTSNERWMN